MKFSGKYIILAVMSAIALSGMAQDSKFSVKASTEIGLSNSFSTTPSIHGLSAKASGCNTDLEMGWTFYQKYGHSLEANIGFGYSPMTTKLSLGATNYNYSAPASADEDGEAYVRYYELGAMSQKVKVSRISMPVYLSYAYKCNDWLKVHADFGVRIGLGNTSSKLDYVCGSAYSYGVYPQYDDLKIDASYMNGFGTTDLADAACRESVGSKVSSSILVGVGAEFRLVGPLSADVSFRYNGGISDEFKPKYQDAAFSATTAPVTYTVKDGQCVKPLTNYLKSSKLNQFMLRIGLTYRF